MEIHTREMMKPIDENEFYEQAKHIVVEFVFGDLTVLNLVEAQQLSLRLSPVAPVVEPVGSS